MLLGHILEKSLGQFSCFLQLHSPSIAISKKAVLFGGHPKERLLVLDASKRHTAEEALRHPWLLSVNTSAEKVGVGHGWAVGMGMGLLGD